MDLTLFPAHYKGARTVASTYAEKPTRHDAILLFDVAKSRLLDVNGWHKLCGPPSPEFQLTDERGQEINRLEAQVGDLIRIKLPASPNVKGNGYDWLRVEAFESSKDLLKDEDVFGFRVRPVKSPFELDEASAHYYTSNATTSFLIVRVSSKVTAMEKGRNEVSNDKPFSIRSKLRNLVVRAGSMIGFSQTQWIKLVKGIIKGPPQD